MEQKKEINREHILYAVIAVMAIALIVAFSKINALESEIDVVRNNLASETSFLQTNIASVYTNVDEQLKQQASILSVVDCEYGELDTESKTATLSLTVVPKELTADMQVSVTVGERTVQFTRNESQFKADVSVDLFIDYDYHPLLTITTADETKTEYLDKVDVSYLFGRYLSQLYSNYSGGIKLSNGQLIYDGYLSIESKPASNETTAKFKSYEIVAELNGVEISRVDITDDIDNDGFYRQDYNARYDAGMGDELIIYIVAVDHLGFVHKDLASQWHETEDGAGVAMAETVYGGERIYDSQGNLLYGKYE